jgi:anti-anti-sigma factor
MRRSKPPALGNVGNGGPPAHEETMARLVSSTKQGSEGLVALGGELTGEESTPALEEWIEEHFVDDGVATIRIDVSEVSQIDLEGVAGLGLLAAEAVKQQKELIVEGATGQVQRKLEETGLVRYLQARNPD